MTSNSDVVLDDLAKEINEHDQARRAAEVKGMMHFIKIGELLNEAKKVVPHGQFMDWVKGNTTSANARHNSTWSPTGSSTLRSALKFLATPTRTIRIESGPRNKNRTSAMPTSGSIPQTKSLRPIDLYLATLSIPAGTLP